jgi:lipoprotein-anchoring transpeptidase ErfK/SrfK
VVGGGTTLYNRTDSTAPVARLPVRTPLYRLGCEDPWCRVRTEGGRTGFVPAAAVSNVWLHISKADRRLSVYRGPRLVDVYEIDVGYNTFADKKRKGSPAKRDHWRTPEGTFYVVDKKTQSSFYKALVLNYPTIADAERGLETGLISRGQYEAIVRAQKQRRMPPMGTELGGWIEIHGDGTGGATNWTQGCVAVRNPVMDALWLDVGVGTPVLIE